MHTLLAGSSAVVIALAAAANCQRVAPATDQPPPAVADQPSSVIHLFEGRASAYGTPAEVVVRDRATWEATWQRLHRGPPSEPLPEVDFARDMVVLVALGERPSGGYGVRVTGVAAEPAGAVVRYTVTEPGPDCMSTQALTAPVDVVRVPRVQGAVRFERRTETERC